MSDAAFVQNVLTKRKDYYAVLGVARGAADDQVKRAYKKAALKCHPDKNTHPKAAEAFKVLNTAHSVLTDPAKRSTYDRYGADGVQAAESGASPHRPAGRPGGGAQYHTDADVFADFFAHMFGAPPPRARPRPQPNYQRPHQGTQQAEVPLSFAMLLPFIAFILLAFALQSATFSGGEHYGAPSPEALRQTRRAMFSLRQSYREGFVRERVTRHVDFSTGGGGGASSEPRVTYFVRPNFDEMARRYGVSLRSVELEVLRIHRAHLDRRCIASLRRDRQRGKAARRLGHGAEPGECVEAQKLRHLPAD